MELSKYYEMICREPLIDRETEFDLFMLLEDEGLPDKERRAIRDRIVRANLRFVFKQAKKFSKNDPDMFQELIAAGNEGLLVGMEKYNPSRQVRFLSYAGWWVIQRILNQMTKMRIVALPIWKQQLASRIQKVCEQNENITFEELKKSFPEVPDKDLHEMYETKYLTYYIDTMSDSDPSFHINPIETEVEERLDRERLNRFVDELPSPHKEIIILSFGLSDACENTMTHTSIAAELKLTKEQVREYKKEALSILQSKITSS